MFTTAGLSEPTQNNLATLGKTGFVQKYYLAGGTALSLHLGHRFSNDLDFFSPTPEEPLIIRSSLEDQGELEIFQNEEGTFNGQLNSVKLSFFWYPYDLLQSLREFQDIKVAAIEDIACMKLDAISSRGTKRDFIDLYAIIQEEYGLDELLELFDEKYSKSDYSRLHLLKSLTYFEDAEGDEMPRMINDINWGQVKEFFTKEVPKLVE